MLPVCFVQFQVFAQALISEVGLDMSRWKTEKHFASWLGLCPDNRTSGGKVLKRGTRRVVNRAATALRLAAWSLIRSRSALGAKFRRLRSRLGAPKAITAMAHTLARLVYRMLKFGQQYVDLSWLSVKWRRAFSVSVDSAPAGRGFSRHGVYRSDVCCSREKQRESSELPRRVTSSR